MKLVTIFLLLGFWVCLVGGSYLGETYVRAGLPAAPLHRDMLAGVFAGGRKAVSRWFYTHGILAADANRSEEAWKELVLSLELYPEGLNEWIQAAFFLDACGLRLSAERILQRGYERSKDAEVGFNLGWFYQTHGDDNLAYATHMRVFEETGGLKSKVMAHKLSEKLGLPSPVK
jgi:hypothetical protein